MALTFGPNQSPSGAFNFDQSEYLPPGAETPIQGAVSFGPNMIGAAFAFGGNFVPVPIADIVTISDVVIVRRDPYVIDIYPR